MSDQLFPEMYTPGSWASVTNEVYPQIAQAVAAESRAVANNSRRAIERGYGAPRLSWPRADQLIRRAGSSNTTQFTSHAILCGDRHDLYIMAVSGGLEVSTYDENVDTGPAARVGGRGDGGIDCVERAMALGKVSVGR